jgi:hypothetical protein
MNPHDYTYVAIGQTWLYPSDGSVLRVMAGYPAIGSEGKPTFTMRDENTGDEFVLDKIDFSYYELKLLDDKDVPMALLGRDQ